MKFYSDSELINGLLSEDPKVYNYIYKACFPLIERMVINLGGRSADAEDIFQDALIVIYRKVIEGELRLSCKFSTYLYSIGQKIWVQQLKSAGMKNVSNLKNADMVCEPNPAPVNEASIFSLVEKHMRALSKDCQKILRLHFNRATIEQICKIMGYNSNHHTMDRKFRCKQSLIKRIQNDPDFKEIKDEYNREDGFLY